jgi:hypothetical protein
VGLRFAGGASFYSTRFTGEAGFNKATFTGGASSYNARFTGNTRFTVDPRFVGTSFAGTSFAGGASFYNTRFTGDTSFDNATFVSDPNVLGMVIEQRPELSGVSPLKWP